ncbi:hypothetical protein AQUCO_03100042v1 [Aquilegia coerulea]|uniref:Myb-like domain-containing protein n=1 Tax=Aquilegia coerulea TaxID=218851 RepID=A0A2G5D0I7_AQUCA|nr:hypothetical protein AQUCO_03100042v1 [Aquilegia coerulea]
MDLQTLLTPIKRKRISSDSKPTTNKRSNRNRNSRSQIFPNWSLHEMLILVNQVSSIESDFMKSMSSYQKWNLVSSNCNSLGVVRSLNQCRRQWDLLLDEYQRIKDWESQSGISYWFLDNDSKLELGLPKSFEKQLFLFVDDNVKAQEEQLLADSGNSDPDFNVAKDTGSKKKRRCRGPQESRNEEEQQMAIKLREQADRVHAILKGDTECNSYSDLKGPGEIKAEFRRWQGKELIKVLGSLVGTIDKLSDLVQDG